VYWVSGLGAALLLGAAILYVRSRSFPSRPAVTEGYRAEGDAGDARGDNLRALAILLLLLFAISQLLYVWMYVELAQWLAGSRDPPRIVFDLFFWVLLIFGTFLGGALYSGLVNEGS
jgi:hypothetical protein